MYTHCGFKQQIFTPASYTLTIQQRSLVLHDAVTQIMKAFPISSFQKTSFNVITEQSL